MPSTVPAIVLRSATVSAWEPSGTGFGAGDDEQGTGNSSVLDDFNPEDIESIEIRVDPGHFRVCNILEPRSGLEAKFSLRFTAAMALAGVDTASIEIFTDALTRQPELVAFRNKVRVVAHETPNPDSVVTITTADGTTHREAVNVAIPERDLEAQWGKLEHKFHTLVDGHVGRAHADGLAGLVRTLESQDDLGDFFSLLRVQR